VSGLGLPGIVGGAGVHTSYNGGLGEENVPFTDVSDENDAADQDKSLQLHRLASLNLGEYL
jgi:hypothetical protein